MTNLNEAKNKERAKKELHVYALMFFIALAVAILTWIIPAGEFTRVVENGRTMVVPGSYQHVESNPVGFFEFFMSEISGFTGGASIIFMIFFIGGAVKIWEDSGFLGISLRKVMTTFKGKEEWTVIAISIIFSLVGATGALANSIIAFIPIGYIVAKSMGYDGMIGFAMTYLASFIGYTAGWANVLTVGIAHSLAELPPFSGMAVRIGIHILFMGQFLWYLVRYCRRTKKDPNASICYEPENKVDMSLLENTGAFDIRQKLIGVTLLAGFVFLVYGGLKWGWGVNQFSATFVIMGIIAGLLGGMGINGTAKSFVAGCKNMTYGALIVGMARAIPVLIENGKIMDTLINWLSAPIGLVGPEIGASFIFLLSFLIAIPIISSSGLAATIMPIVIPLADVTGITRQVAVTAFQFGDAITNPWVPTASIMLASIAMCGIPYSKYLKWYFPMVAFQCIAGVVILTVGQILQWGPM